MLLFRVFILIFYTFIMETKNTYSFPIDKGAIIRAIEDVPTHVPFTSESGTFCDFTNAIDFLCEEGTPVKASLEGEVVSIKSDLEMNYDKFDNPSEESLPLDKRDGNFVVIKHVNDEFSIYCHLKANGVVVKSGQVVKAGEVIGYSGNTGWSIKPHLHFMVFRFLKPFPVRDLESLKIEWK
jgi:hypothetical protein